MINYKNLQTSIEYYSLLNYTRIEVPWTVSTEVSKITKPSVVKQDWIIEGKNKSLVASAEQGFLYLYLKEFLPKGRFQAVSPCFRDEVWDYLHTKYFMKNELIITDNINKSILLEMIDNSRLFFKNQLSHYNAFKDTLLTIDSIDQNNYDINYNGLELGSYGIRECDYLKWIYGTGCAEPRLSAVQNILQKQI